PVLLVTGLFVLAVGTMRSVDSASPDALMIKVTGHQWWWEYQYPAQGIVTANELVVPVGVPLRLEVDGADVIHSFWVPSLGYKKDAVPTRTNVMWVTAERAGRFEGACTEFCGAQHAWMRILVSAVAGDQFDAWVQQQGAAAAAPADATTQRGQRLVLQQT